MTQTVHTTKGKRKLSTIRRWVRYGFISWAIVSTAWLANSVRTQGVDAALLKSNANVAVFDNHDWMEFRPSSQNQSAGLIFVCGSGIAAEAYAPLLRPIAESGYAVCIVRLPLRFAPLESHKQETVDRVFRFMQGNPQVTQWVVAGHSLGAALVCRAVVSKDPRIAGLVLLGTTHPKREDLSGCRLPVTKVYATNDGIAPPDDVLANSRLLPATTTWVAIPGGNHSQFGHYGHQLFDGAATLSRSDQQQIARSEMLELLRTLSDELSARP